MIYNVRNWRSNSSCDLVIVLDIWDFRNMFNFRIITVNPTALSIIANCNYLHIDHCHIKMTIKESSVCE